MNAIETAGIAREFNGLTAVAGIDLRIEKGKLFSLLGPNGAGKTTLVRMLCCLLRPTAGTAFIMGHDIIGDSFKVKGLIGVSPQETVLSERLNCWENLSLVGKMHRMSSGEIKERSQELLRTMGLTERADEQVKKFSGGMKRRLSIAMSLVHDPAVLFLDEPTLGLDPQARRAVWEHIALLKEKKTILLTTHYMEEADSLSDCVGIIDEGKIVALGTPEELKRNFFTGCSMVIRAEDIPAGVMQEMCARYARVEKINGGVEISHKELDLHEIVEYLFSRGVIVSSATLKQPTLEDVFIQITGKRLRE
jgi:ABC-2 type transport system ATP-binding protein